MAVQPIDLQTMYSQMANVAQNVAQAQDGPRLAEAMVAQNVAQKDMRKAEAVGKASNENAASARIKNNGAAKGGGGGGKKSSRQGEKSGDGEDAEAQPGALEPYVGHRVNIVR